MIWQDLTILAAQVVCLVALVPTLRDRTKWPHRGTAAATSAALIGMAIALGSLSLWFSTTLVAALAVAWARMAWR
jgi:hypothetical protein